MEPNDTSSEDLTVFNEIVSALKKLDPDRRERVLGTVLTFLGIEWRTVSGVSGVKIRSGTSIEDSASVSGGYSEDRSISPKDFLLEKQPRTDVERIACLAYYLTHYRDMPYFKTLDVSTLNTEAAQLKLSNPAHTVNNAVKLGYLAPAPQGQKQLSAVGEKFVRALPNRDAAREVLAIARPRRKKRKLKSKETVQNDLGER